MDKNFTFDVNKLQQYVKILTDNYKLKIDAIPEDPKIKESYAFIDDLIRSGPEGSKSELIKLIRDQYRPSQIVPETVGSFLFGCFQQTYGDIPAECSPLCSYGILNGDGLTLERCDSQIHIQYLDQIPEDEKPRFIKLGRSKSGQGYIFVNLDFLGFTHNEKKYLVDNGLSKVQILVTKDSKHHTIIKMREINDIPIIEYTGGHSFVTSDKDERSEKHELLSDDNSYMYMIFAFIIVVVIAFAYNR